MTVALLAMAFLIAVLLVLVTLVQMLYMDSVRVRAREIAFLVLFRDRISERIGLKPDDGILTFSLVKHSLLASLGVVFLGFASGRSISGFGIGEGLIMSLLTTLVSCYIVPQFLYRRTTGEWFTPFVGFVHGIAITMRPLTATLGFLQSLTQLSEKEETVATTSTPEENINALITAGAEEGILEEDDRKLIQSVVAFGDKTVREVMTPRPSIVAVPATSTLDDLRELVINEQYSRIPIFEDTIDSVIGFVHVRDMFNLDPAERSRHTVREIVRPIRTIPETKPVNDLLKEMQSEATHMAVVIDEYGSTAGLVTMEDLVEEIVGEIRDEHEPGDDVHVDHEGSITVSGSYDLDHLTDLFGFRPDEDTESTTVGGLVTEWLGHVPKPGEVIERDGLHIEVLNANDLRVEQVRISRAVPTSDAHSDTDTIKER